MGLGRAKLAMGRGVSIWVLEAPEGFGDPHVHAHHAIQLTFSLSGSLALYDERRAVDATAIAVAPDAPHRFVADGLLVFIFVEPESRAGRAISEALFAEGPIVEMDAALLTPLVSDLAATFEPGLTPSDLMTTGETLVAAFAPTGAANLPDPRIRKVIDHANAHLEPSLAAAAEAAGVYLSPSRLRHMFVEQTGLAYKTYLLWARLVRALDVYASGQSLTEAAHAAGFADSAHFSRTFKRTFGLPATTLERL